MSEPAETPDQRRARLQAEIAAIDAAETEPAASGGDAFADVLAKLDDDTVGDSEWGESRQLDEVGLTVAGWWRGQEEWEGDYGPTPVYLMTDEAGFDFYFFGGRAQLDRKIKNASPSVGDRVAVRRLEDGTPAEGQSPPWRVRVAVVPGDGTIPGRESEDDIPF